MRKIVVLVAAAVAAVFSLGCRSARPGGQAGALTAPAAVQEFLAAARGGSIGSMAGLFGTASGSIAQRDSPNDVEQRMRALQCHLTHDAARVLEDLPGNGYRRRITVELPQRDLVRRTTFTAIPGPHARWFVSEFDIQAVADLCRP